MRGLWLFRAAVAAMIPAIAMAQPAAEVRVGSPPEAVAIVRTIYDQATAACSSGGNARFDPYAIARNAFEDDLAGRYMRALKNGKIDFDIFVAGQDCELSEVNVSALSSTPTTASVRAAFRNFGQPMTIDYELRRGQAGWKIREIAHRHDPFSLRRTLGFRP